MKFAFQLDPKFVVSKVLTSLERDSVSIKADMSVPSTLKKEFELLLKAIFYLLYLSYIMGISN